MAEVKERKQEEQQIEQPKTKAAKLLIALGIAILMVLTVLSG